MGQRINNIEAAESCHYRGTRGDLLITYRLRSPIHLASISDTATFELIAPAPDRCPVHQQPRSLAVDHPTTDSRLRIIRPTYCCGRMEELRFRVTLLSSEINL